MYYPPHTMEKRVKKMLSRVPIKGPESLTVAQWVLAMKYEPSWIAVLVMGLCVIKGAAPEFCLQRTWDELVAYEPEFVARYLRKEIDLTDYGITNEPPTSSGESECTTQIT